MSATDDEFTEFVRANQSQLVHAATLITGSRAKGEDLTQEALLKTYVAWGRVRQDEAFAYTRRVMVNHNIDRWRLRHREPVLTKDGNPADGPSHDGHGVEHRDEIVRALAPLSRRERTIVVLRYYFDLTEVRVADELGISVGTVKSTCSRALARISPATSPDGSAR